MAEPTQGLPRTTTEIACKERSWNALMSLYNDCEYEIGRPFLALDSGIFDERFTFKTSSPYLTNSQDVYLTKDQFNVQNNFYGGQFGLDVNYVWDCLTLDFLGKIALGATCGKVTIHGHLLTNDFNTVHGTRDSHKYEGGLFALPTNSGSQNNWFFAVIPEVDINLGYQVSECLRLNVGYTYLAVNKMLRACEQIDRDWNTTQSDAVQFKPVAELVGRPGS